jgi:elongation factor Ts
MSNITPQMIKDLRERTGVGMLKCKEALEESHGDIEKAIVALRKAGIASAVKKEAREAKEGAIDSFETDTCIGICQMNAETDFVVNNEKFRDFLKQMTKEVVSSKIQDLSSFLSKQYSKESEKTIDEKRKELIAVLGENILVTKIIYLKKAADTSYGIYSHMNGKIFTLVELQGSSDQAEFAKEIAMHVAADAPEYLSKEHVPVDIVAAEEEIAKSRIPSGKPADIINKILAGKMEAFYNGICLVNQKYIKDPSSTVLDVVNAKGKQIGKNLKIKGFYRLQVGL